MGRRLPLLVLVLLLVATAGSVVVSSGTGYIAIQDLVGRTWTYQDVQKILTTVVGVNGTAIGDYFEIYVNGVRFTLRHFMPSPLDGSTAVLPIGAGQHEIEIRWLRYIHRQIVNVVPNYHTVVKLDTAPVAPLTVSTAVPDIYEWDVTYHPNGLTFMRRDGNAWIRLNYQTNVITYAQLVGGKWVYQNITASFPWTYYTEVRFGIRDPRNPANTTTRSGCFFFFCWDIYKQHEELRYNRTGHVFYASYVIAASGNEGIANAVNELLKNYGTTFNDIVYAALSPAALLLNPNTIVTTVTAVYNMWMSIVFPSRYQGSVVIIYDFFLTPTQVLILAHVYRVDNNGNVTPLNVSSSDVFTVGNRLVFHRILAGTMEYLIYEPGTFTANVFFSGAGGSFNRTITEHSTIFLNSSTYNTCNIDPQCVRLPGGRFYQFRLDDMSRYQYEFLVRFTEYYTGSSPHSDNVTVRYVLVTRFNFTNTQAATVFSNRLLQNNISHVLNGTVVDLIMHSAGPYRAPINAANKTQRAWMIQVPPQIIDLIPFGSNGIVTFIIQGYVLFQNDSGGPDSLNYTIEDFAWMVRVYPRLDVPEVSLLTNGFARIGSTAMARIYASVVREDNNTYVLSYYVLDNDPPPVYLIRDVYYDIERDVVHYVYSIVSIDAYRQELISYNYTVLPTNETIWDARYRPNIRTINTTISLFDYNRMRFLNLAPELIRPLLAVSPDYFEGYGTVTVDWATASLITITTTSIEYYREGAWRGATIIYYNNTFCIYDGSALVECIHPGNVSSHYYKVVINGTEYRGFLFNDNGVLKMISGNIYVSLTGDELQRILQKVKLESSLQPPFQFTWPSIDQNMLLVIAIAAAVFILIIIIIAAAGRTRVVVAR